MNEDWSKPVVEKYGQEMFDLVMAAGMATSATRTLTGAIGKYSRRLDAVATLAESFNRVSNAYAKKMEWSKEILAQCDRDVLLAFSGKLVVPKGIILDS